MNEWILEAKVLRYTDQPRLEANTMFVTDRSWSATAIEFEVIHNHAPLFLIFRTTL